MNLMPSPKSASEAISGEEEDGARRDPLCLALGPPRIYMADRQLVVDLLLDSSVNAKASAGSI